MFDFIQKLMYSFLNLQKKILDKKHGKRTKSVYFHTTSKKILTQSVSLELTSRTEKNKLKLERNVKIILKKYNNNPKKLIEFIQKNGTKVYRIHFAKKILALIKYEEGLIGETRGLKSLYLNIIISLLSCEKRNLALKTEPMFVLNKSGLDNYLLIQQFHKWYATKLKLPGFDHESQDNFQKFIISNKIEVKSLDVEALLGLKEAIARDVEAINFIVDFAKSTAGSRNALKKMTEGGASI